MSRLPGKCGELTEILLSYYSVQSYSNMARVLSTVFVRSHILLHKHKMALVKVIFSNL